MFILKRNLLHVHVHQINFKMGNQKQRNGSLVNDHLVNYMYT